MQHKCPQGAGPPLNWEATWSARSHWLAGNVSPPPWPSAEHAFSLRTWLRAQLAGAPSNQDPLGFWLLEHAWLSPCWRPGSGTSRRRVHTNGSWVSSGPAGPSALGHLGVHFSLTGAWSPQDLLGGDGAEGKGEEKWGEGSCVWLTSEGVCLQRTQEGKGLMWKTGVLVTFVCGVDRVQCCSLVRGIWFSQHHLLRGLSFPWYMFLAPFLWIDWPHTCRFIPVLSALFLWSVCLFLCQFHTFLGL